MKIVFATNNQHKLQEIRDILGSIDEKIRQIDRYPRAIVDDSSNTRYATCYYLVWKQEYRPSKGVNQEA